MSDKHNDILSESIKEAVAEYTPEQWVRWAKYKSNKDLWIEAEERDLE